MRPDRPNRPDLLAVLVMPFIALTALQTNAQRSVRLQLNPTNNSGIELTWQPGSVVPLPGLQLFPDYQVHRSHDLVSWTPVGGRFVGNIGGTNRFLSFVDTGVAEANAFYRVESIVDLQFADLIGEDLTGAEFHRANLFGADLFNAGLGKAKLPDAILSGADLRFAVLTNADLTRADLFAA